MKKTIAILAALSATAIEAFAGEDSFSFKHITMQDGLSSNKVNSTYRDSRGFIWISTSCGLNRFDGYTMKAYLWDFRDSTTMRGNYVSYVHDIAGERMLVASRNIYTIFDKRTETFTPADYIFKAASASQGSAKIFIDSDKNIWIADGSTCSIFSTEQETVTQRSLKGDTDSRITAFCESKDRMYATHTDGTISVFSKDGSGIWQHCSTIESTAPDNSFYELFIDSSGNFWMTPMNRYGLWFRSAATGEWKHCDSKTAAPWRMPDFVIRKVVEDNEGRIWVASDHGGINIIDLRSGSMTEVRSHRNKPRSLLSNSISDIYSDNQGCIWVDDVSLGISVFGEPIYKFGIDNLEVDEAGADFVAQVNCVAEDSNGNLWYGTNDNGLIKADVATGSKHVYKNRSGDSNSLPSNIVVSVCPDDKGGLWIGTFLGGLCHYDGQKFKHYKGDASMPPAAAADNVWTVCQGINGQLWVGSLGYGAAMIDQRTGKWTQWGQKDGLQSEYVSKIVSMRDGRTAIGTSDGVCVVDLSRSEAVIPVCDSALKRNMNIVDLCYDTRGLLWICTNAGLHIVDGKTLKYAGHIGQAEGLPTEAILGITEDKRRIMWVTTTHGISSVEVTKDDRDGNVSFRTYNYNDQDGTLVGSINERAIACTSSDEIIVGRANGVNRFRPEKIRYNTEKPKVTFTTLSTFGKETPIGAETDGEYRLSQALMYCDEIELPYDVNMFSVTFSTLSNILPEKVTYTYKLEGFNSNWITTSDNNATYTNLSPGEYRLIVRAANCDGLECEEAAELRIVITPPWWLTGWAYFVYVVLIIGGTFLSIKWIRDRDKAKFRIRQMMDEVEHQRQVDDLKLRFFTNVSHELRTPLSLIVSPLENILDSMSKDDPNHDQIELIHRNAIKLLNMVNQILDFRKTDMGGMTLNLSEGDLVSFTKLHCDSYVMLDKKDIDFSFSSSTENIYMKFDKDKIGKVVTNLLSNAYKFTPAGGSVSVAVSLSEDRKKARISVADTGVGIADEHKTHIFERFYQVPQKDASIAGSGIGLHLVKDFVSMHSGNVSVVDNAGGGSEFIVELPVNLGIGDNTEEKKEPVKTEPTVVEAENEEKVPNNGKRLILIVDDNADFLSLLHDTLKADYDIIEASNGQEAFEKVVDKMPDLIITDVMMPIMDGNELCSKVKSDIRTSHIPLIMLTAKTAEEHNIEGLANGADDYLTKPFNPKILRLKVEKMVEQNTRRQQTFKNQIEPEPSQITITTLDEQLIKKAIAYVEENIASPNLSVEDLSRSLGMSRVHLYKKLTSITGRSPLEFIRVLRLKRAAQMLKDPSQNVADVAYAVGFNNPKYFTKYFKEEFGILPSKYYQQTDKSTDSQSKQQ